MRDRNDDEDVLIYASRAINIGPGATSCFQVRLTLISERGVELKLESRRLEQLLGGPRAPALRPNADDLVGSTPHVGDEAVQGLYAQAARRAACHERMKAPPETINLDYVYHRPR